MRRRMRAPAQAGPLAASRRGRAGLARRPNLDKPGARGLFVAESFGGTGGAPGGAGTGASTLAGVVMRRDLVIDGFVLGSATIGGADAAERIASMHARLGRRDVGLVAVSGAVISSYNAVDLPLLRERAGVPAVAVSYGEPAGGGGGTGAGCGGALAGRLAAVGPSGKKGESRAAVFSRLGPRARIRLRTSHDLFVRCAGCSPAQAGRLLDSMTVQGSMPEPFRIARLLARAACRPFARPG